MASNQIALQLTASFDTYTNEPQTFTFSAELSTVESGREYAAQFPKSTKLFATSLSTADGIKGWVVSRSYLTSDKVNGGVNEAALRRYQAILKAAAKLGIQIEYARSYSNSYATREEFEAAISAEASN